MATPGTILRAPTTLQLAEGWVQVVGRGPVAVKGLPAPVEIYALTGANAQRSRLHVAAARGSTRFVGRDAELEHLTAATSMYRDMGMTYWLERAAAAMAAPALPQSSTIDNASFGHRRTACSTRSRSASGGCSCLICSRSSSSTTKISGTRRTHTALLSHSVRFTITRMPSSVLTTP